MYVHVYILDVWMCALMHKRMYCVAFETQKDAMSVYIYPCMYICVCIYTYETLKLRKTRQRHECVYMSMYVYMCVYIHMKL